MTEPVEPIDIVTSAREVFELPSIEREDVWRLIERNDQAAQAADTSFTKRMATMVATWLAAYAISRNFVSEGSIGSFTVSQLPLITLVPPVILAVLQHNGLAIILASKVAGAIERAGYRKLFPSIARRQIDAVNFSVTPLGLEGIITGRTLRLNGFLWLSSGILLISLFIGPFILVWHGLYLT